MSYKKAFTHQEGLWVHDSLFYILFCTFLNVSPFCKDKTPQNVFLLSPKCLVLDNPQRTGCSGGLPTLRCETTRPRICEGVSQSPLPCRLPWALCLPPLTLNKHLAEVLELGSYCQWVLMLASTEPHNSFPRWQEDSLSLHFISR